jgi:hypothetical protein
MAMLTSENLETREGCVTIRDFEPDIVTHFVDYLYDFKLEETDLDCDLLQLVNRGLVFML